MLLLDVIIILGLIAVLSPQRQVDPFDMLPNMKTERLGTFSYKFLLMILRLKLA